MTDSATSPTPPPIRFYGHATLTFETPTGEVVMIDPWVKHNPACPPELHEPDRIDAMLITHAHWDHFEDAMELALQHQPEKVVANNELCGWMGQNGVKNVEPMNPGGSQEVFGCKVTMVRAEHTAGLQLGDRMVYGGVATGFVVTMPSGFAFYHPGDTALFGDMALIGELYKPHLGFLPVGDRFTMGPLEAAYACELLKLRQVVPMHYGTFPQLTGTPEEFERELAARGYDCEILRLAPGDTL